MSGELDSRADALLAPVTVSGETLRDACVALADAALSLSGGDPETAREPLRAALEAVGAIA
jgi:hypothetical protein